MTLHAVILLNAVLDLGIVLALAATMLLPFGLDRRKQNATIYDFATPLPVELAA